MGCAEEVIPSVLRQRGPYRRLTISTVVAVLVAAATSFLPNDSALQGWLTDISVSIRAVIFGERPLDSDHVVVVGMDERSLDAPELLPYPRALFSPVYTAIAEKAFDAGAKGMLFDIILAYDARGMKVAGETPLKSYDTPFLKRLRAERKSGRMILGWSARLLPARRFLQVAGNDALGLTVIPFGAGNVVREVPPLIPDEQGGVQPTLSGRAMSLLGAEVTEEVSIVPPAPYDTLPAVSMVDIIRCQDPEALRRAFEGKVLFLGGLLPGEDRIKGADRFLARHTAPVIPEDPCTFPRPLTREPGEEALPGVFIHAAAVDAVLSGWAPAPAPPWLATALSGMLAFVISMTALVFRPVVALAGLLVGLGTVFAASVAALEAGVLLAIGGTLLAGPAAFAMTWGIRLRLLDRRENAIRREFGRFLSPILVQQMIETGVTPALGGEERDVTILFADLSGFTTTSESLESAELTALLNRYLNRIASVVQDHNGYVDKFIGDAVMAIWNAPAPMENHALAGVEAAHDIVAAVAALGAEDGALGKPTFAIKVGICSGPATVGNIGAADRMNYTVIGETVNLAARFESLPALLNTPIVIGPRTAEKVVERYEVLPIVSIQVKGKTEGVVVSAPIALRDEVTAEVRAALEDYAIALKAFEEGAFEIAAELWDELATRDWPGAGPSEAMAEESRLMNKQLLLTPWTGVLEARSK
ncbi:MAG: adenylate/guanylate cyclase domain-containing protein [Pseudomonadota bacterium]